MSLWDISPDRGISFQERLVGGHDASTPTFYRQAGNIIKSSLLRRVTFVSTKVTKIIFWLQVVYDYSDSKVVLFEE